MYYQAFLLPETPDFMLDVIILAIALSMDAFAVSIGLGSKARSKPHSLALIAALYFGVFQGLMPLIGYLGGSGALSLVGDYSHLIAFGLLLLIGGKMLFEGFQEGVEDEITMISQRILLTLAIATSIDALAAGFSLTLLPVNAFLACLIIASVTFVFSWAGVMMSGHLQKTSGSWLESRAEILGGLVLIGLAFKFLLL